jgi:hypothetical protein
MNLAKWLTLNGSLKHVGGESRFTLPPVYRGRYEFNSVKVNDDELSSDVKPLDKKETFSANQQKTSDRRTCPPVEKDNCEISFNKTVSADYKPVKKVLKADAEEAQLTLDGWKEKSVSSDYSLRSTTSAISYHSVGRWAVKRVTKYKLPKPPPVQREFRFNDVKVVRNDLQFSDIEIVAKPGNRLFDKMVSYVCSLISWIHRVLIKKLKRI